MVKAAAILITICLLVGAAQGQEMLSEQSLLKATATLSPGYLLEQKTSNNYLHGHLEYYPEEKVSLRGDSYWFLDSQQEDGLLLSNSTLLFGCNYHFVKGAFDPYFGFQPGFNISQVNYLDAGVEKESAVKAVPVLSLSAGANYFVSRYFNFFASATYVRGTFVKEVPAPVSLDEIRLSLGLGFNIHTTAK